MRRELLLLAIAVVALYFGVQQLDYHVNPWLNTVVTSGEAAAAEQFARGTPQDTVFMSDIFGGELVMGLAARSAIIGGDWAANPAAPRQMSDAQEFYKTASADRAAELMRKYNITYAVFPDRKLFCGYGWIDADESKMADPRFSIAFDATGVRVYALRSDT